MFRRIGQMKPEEVFTRIVFGVIMIGSTFIPGGRWMTFTLGILFLISAFQGFCVTCSIYKCTLGRAKERKDTKAQE